MHLTMTGQPVPMSQKHRFFTWRNDDMARKKQDTQEKNLWEKAKWQGFVSITLQTAEKKAIKDGLLSEEQCLQLLIDAATDGYKVSLSYSIPEDVFTVALTGVYKDKPNAGLTMSMRHKDVVTAITAVGWCLTEAGKEGSWEERFGSTSHDDW